MCACAWRVRALCVRVRTLVRYCVRACVRVSLMCMGLCGLVLMCAHRGVRVCCVRVYRGLFRCVFRRVRRCV